MKKSKVLLIDDVHVDRTYSKAMLETINIEVIELEDATNCLDVLVKENPDLVLLDIMMPQMNGNLALQLIRKKYSQVVLPVIMVTSKLDALDVVDALKAGANDYITKPFHFDIALHRIKSQLAMAEQSKILIQMKKLDAVYSTIAVFKNEISEGLGTMQFLKNQHEIPEIVKLESVFTKMDDSLKKIEQIIEKSSSKI